MIANAVSEKNLGDFYFAFPLGGAKMVGIPVDLIVVFIYFGSWTPAEAPVGCAFGDDINLATFFFWQYFLKIQSAIY